jgi:chemosensory pili system protein ChpA (sensor histidine kinase/response regulator)
VPYDATVEFDRGPLSWVQGEIGQALARGIDALAAFGAASEDRASLQHARNHVHQAAGAIRMVGLDAVVAFTDEIERQLTRLEDLPATEVPRACEAVDRACRKLRIFLDEVANGAAPVALILFPEYEAMQRARGMKAAAPTDLFYPDLGTRVPDRAPGPDVPAHELPAHLVQQRRTYQHGLLALMRGDLEGARAMCAAAAGIEGVTAQPGLRVFWWTVGALFDAVASGDLPAEFGVKQLAGRIDLQIRRFVAGSAKVADRLRREVLYYIAIATPGAASVAGVQKAFRLSGLIPSAAVLNADLVRLQPLLRDVRERLAAAKDAWLKVTSGRAENLPKLVATLASAHASAVEIGNAALTRLTAALAERLEGLAAPGEIPEHFAMEYATGMLLAESAVENFAGLGTDFPRQVDAMLERLDAARSARVAPAASAPLLDEMSKRAQERLLLAQVTREIQANLRHMEQVLDAFFRDHTKSADLAALAKDSQQVRGALQILGLDGAARLLGLCEQQIATYTDPATAVDDVDLELLAESLSGLGFYVEAVEQQRPERERLIAPLLARRLGEAPQVDAVAGESIEASVEELRSALPALVAEVHRVPMDPAARVLLAARLGELLDDAKLMGDAELVTQAEEALHELESGGAEALQAAVTAIAGGPGAPAPAPVVSDETRRLLTIAATRLDAELVEIYLAEAADVLDTIAAQRAVLLANPGDREALRTVRRQFHTLKGSGRMVGLVELGELARDVETIHNRLLEEERPVTPAVLALIGVAERDFRRWVAALADVGRVDADPAELHAAIRDVEAELPGARESVLQPPAGATTSEVAAPVVAAPVVAAPVVAAPDVAESAPVTEVAAPLPDLVVPTADDEIASFDLPELGSVTAGGAPRVETLSTQDEHEIIDVGPLAEGVAHPAATTPEIAVEASAAPEPHANEVVIGDVTVSAVLYNILVDEADGHLATLAHEMSLLQFDPRHEPSAAMVRASHTLCGIHRAGGFPLVATTAKSLEQCLLGLPQLTPAAKVQALAVLARAVRCVAQMVGRIKARAAFTEDDLAEAAEVELDLDALRARAVAAAAQTEQDPAAVEMTSPPEPAVTAAGSALTPVPHAEQEREPESALAPEVAWVSETESMVEPEAEPAPVLEPVAAMASPEATVPETAAPEAAMPEAAMPEAAMPEAAAPEAAAPEAAAPDVAAPELPAPAIRPAIVPAPSFADVRDEIDDQVLPIFLEEAAELLPQAGEQLRAWRRAPHDVANARQLRRTLHTFKGSARMAGAMRLGELTHLMESRFAADDTLVTGSVELFEALDTDLDRVSYVLEALRAGRSNVPLPWLDATAAVESAQPPAEPPAAPASLAAAPGIALPTDVLASDVALPDAASSYAEAPAPQKRSVVVPLMAQPPTTVNRRGDGAERAEGESGARAMLRVRADVIDRLANEAGEVAIARARVEGELRSLKANLLELTGSVIRLRAQVREIDIQAESQIQSRMSQVGEAAEGFDPLELDRFTRFQELTRSLSEGVNDVSTVQQALLKNLDDADAALAVQARLSRDVQQQLFSIRTVPFGSVAERLYRVLRATAKELDKRANLDIRGGQTELDRSVLEKLVGPLEHLLRNAIAHGIEARDARDRAGKARTGEITLTVRQVGNEVAIEFADDGAGLDLEGIRARAVASGRLAADAQPTDAQIVECIFEPGFSTASHVTQVAGRGIGMDVVRAEIGALGGRIEVATRPNCGTTFTLTLPLTLAVAQVVLVRVAGRLWALPAPMVEQVLQVKGDALASHYAARRVERQGESYPFHYLPRLFGDAQSMPDVARTNPVLLLRAGANVAAVHVDEMVGNQEVVVKNIGPQLARVAGIAGATVLGSGEIVLIVNAVQLAQRADAPGYDETAVPAAPRMDDVPALPARPRPRVLVVDDSLTVRKITTRLLQREGYKVATAKDGADALEQLRADVPDAILLDIEMPRMDGFEFTRTIKRDPRTAEIPIVMITSRSAEKHRSRARELGVDRYLGKPFQEEELLQHLSELLALTV